MTNVIILFKGRKHPITLSNECKTSRDLKQLIYEHLGSPSHDGAIPPDEQRLIYKGRVLADADALALPADAKIKLVRQANSAARAAFAAAEAEACSAADGVASRVVDDHFVDSDGNTRVPLARPDGGGKRRRRPESGYRFHAIRTLPGLPDEGRARAILEELAHDDGVLAVLEHHRWSVGCLSEMPPDGQMDDGNVHLMGLNKNKGQEILLRLRTDDFRGFRKMLSIRKVLYHELAHNDISPHNTQFFELMRRVEREATGGLEQARLDALGIGRCFVSTCTMKGE